MGDRQWFIALEGVSGVGKTTVATLLARSLAAVVVRTPMSPLDQVRGMFDQSCSTMEARYLFYLASVEASRKVESLLGQSSVVCDRYILSTESYYRALGLKLRINYGELGLLQPDVKVLLVCDHNERMQRIERRGWSFNDIQEERARMTDRFQQEYMKCPCLVISTRNLRPDDAVDRIVSEISSTRALAGTSRGSNINWS